VNVHGGEVYLALPDVHLCCQRTRLELPHLRRRYYLSRRGSSGLGSLRAPSSGRGTRDGRGSLWPYRGSEVLLEPSDHRRSAPAAVLQKGAGSGEKMCNLGSSHCDLALVVTEFSRHAMHEDAYLSNVS